MLALAFSVACNAIFGLSEGKPRPDVTAGAGDASGDAAGASGGVTGVPKGGAGPNTGGTTPNGGGKGGSAEQGGSGAEPNGGGTGGSTGGTDVPSTGGTTAGDAGRSMGGSGELGGSAGLDALGGSGGSGGSGGTTGGMPDANGGMAGMEDTSIGGVLASLDGWTFEASCANDPAPTNTCFVYEPDAGGCPNPDAANFDDRGVTRTVTHPVHGMKGLKYSVTLWVGGAVMHRCYENGVLHKPDSSDHWYTGGNPTQDSTATSYELHVRDASGKQTAVYYLNAFASDVCDDGGVETVSEQVTFDVQGGGQIDAVMHDTDCITPLNCSMYSTSTQCYPLYITRPSGSADPGYKTYPLDDQNRAPQYLFFSLAEKVQG